MTWTCEFHFVRSIFAILFWNSIESLYWLFMLIVIDWSYYNLYWSYRFLIILWLTTCSGTYGVFLKHVSFPPQCRHFLSLLFSLQSLLALVCSPPSSQRKEWVGEKEREGERGRVVGRQISVPPVCVL